MDAAVNRVAGKPIHVVMRPSEIQQASAEAIELLSGEHRQAVQDAYVHKPEFQAKVDAAVAYLAIHTSMAEHMDGDLETFRRVALVDRPWFCDDFDIRLITNAVIDYCALEEAFLHDLYLTRLAALREFMISTGVTQ